MQAIVLSAGFGKRLRPITDKIAKPAVPLLNVPMVGFPLWHLMNAGVRDVVLNLHHLPDTVRESLKRLELERRGVTVRTLIETPDILDSGGGVANAKSLLTADDFFVANADAILLGTEPSNLLKSLLRHHKSEKALATILTCDLGGVGETYGGVVVDSSGQVRGFSKTPVSAPLRVRHYTGFLILSRRFFEYAPKEPSNILYDVLANAISRGEKVASLHASSCLWLETGDGAHLLAASQLLMDILASPTRGPSPSLTGFSDEQLAVASRQLQELLRFYTPEIQFWGKGTEPGVLERSPPGLYWGDGPLLIGRNTTTSGPIQVQGFATIGDGSHIGQDVTLESAILFPNSKISSHASIKQQIHFP